MPSDYDKIRTDNIKEYGEGTRHLSFLGRLYTDRTHFIFELLQNAEDAGASRVLFQLFEDKLEVFHDGRLFDEKDVRGICGVDEGTKTEDLTQIGKFGIGFKSVYAYTSTPEVHSGHESFRIANYVRPFAVQPQDIGDSWTTLFAFPFNKEDVEPEMACREISGRLRKLSARTLLFLRSIKEIEYGLPDGMDGVYLRDEVIRGSAREVTVIGQNNGEDESENWLIFERPVEVPDPGKDCPRQVPVEIGFRLEKNEKEHRDEVVRVKDSPLVVYFPTEKETRLGFLIQGPYKTTPARDNIPKDDDWNATLVRETARLIADVLPQLKDLGLLSVSLLEALPIRMDDFPPGGMFYPIVVAVREALAAKELLPADDGSFVSARNAKMASAEWLRKQLREEQLKLLHKTELKWISGEVTERGRHDLWKYIREGLEVEEITPDSFARKVDSTFFKNQTDQWIVDFYRQLLNQKALWKKGSGSYWDSDGPLRKKPFIRLQDGSQVRPFDDADRPNAYVPAETALDVRLPTVKAEIVKDDEARRFLSDLKIPEFDIVAEVIEHVIPKYTLTSPPKLDEHQRDIEKTLEAFKTDSQEKRIRLKRALQESPFILTKSSISGDDVYRKPNDHLYIQDDTLETYFSGNSDVGFVSAIYQESALDVFKDIGVREDVRIYRRSTDYRGFVKIRDWHGSHERGLYGFDPGIEIDGLEYALTHPTIEKSSFIWDPIAIENADCICGVIESSTRQTYENSDKEKKTSEKFGQLLINTLWLPDKQGNFHKPAELKLDDLPESFVRDEKLANQLGMKKDVVAKLAEEAGISLDNIEKAKKIAEASPEVKEQIDLLLSNSNEKQPEFPRKASSNVDRRRKKTTEKYHKAPKKKYEKKPYSKKVTENTIDPKIWLRETYTNKERQMICQICQNEMPFKKKDGRYYFEAVELLNDFDREMEEFYIALCPLCAAMYNEFVKHDKGAMEPLKNALINSDDAEVPLQLGELDTSVRFVETHYHDIQTILEERK